MREFLWLYTNIDGNGNAHSANPVGGQWVRATDQAARNTGKTHGAYLSCCLWSWSKAYIKDRKVLPLQITSQRCSHIDDESLVADLMLHLQSIGKYVRAQDIVDYLSIPMNHKHHHLKNMISLKTAQQWMKKMGYHWKLELKGQYSDGHEHEDVVSYRQNIFLPAWHRYSPCMRR